jgi:hypothetical protein
LQKPRTEVMGFLISWPMEAAISPPMQTVKLQFLFQIFLLGNIEMLCKKAFFIINTYGFFLERPMRISPSAFRNKVQGR